MLNIPAPMGSKLASVPLCFQYPVFLRAHLHCLSVVRIFTWGRRRGLGNIYIHIPPPKAPMIKCWSPPKFALGTIRCIRLSYRAVNEGCG